MKNMCIYKYIIYIYIYVASEQVGVKLLLRNLFWCNLFYTRQHCRSNGVWFNPVLIEFGAVAGKWARR